jgi:TolB-like protein
MTAVRRFLLLLPLFLLPASLGAQQAQDSRPGIAVLPFERGFAFGMDREMLEAMGVGVQQIMITELSQNTQLRLVDRSVIREILAEQDLGASGRIDDETAARIGRLVGARYVIAGSFTEDGREMRLDGRVVNAETGEILKADQVMDQRDRIYRIIMTLSGKLTQGVNLPPLPREVREARETRAASIPREASVLYAQAQYFQDLGQTERAKTLYRRLTTEFPQLTEAAEALRQIGG